MDLHSNPKFQEARVNTYSWCQWNFHWHKILPIALWPWGRLSVEQKWVPGEFSVGKGGRCVRLTTLPPPCAVVMKSGKIKFLEISGPVQACNGTALPLPFTGKYIIWTKKHIDYVYFVVEVGGSWRRWFACFIYFDNLKLTVYLMTHKLPGDACRRNARRLKYEDQYPKRLAPELFFLILAHPVYKMWIIQEPNTLKLWNKLHFEEKNTEIIHHV